jgi:hypothetical protein
MRKYLRGWNLRLIGEQKERKNRLVERIHGLDSRKGGENTVRNRVREYH